jgi:hypothetical protein
MNLRTHSQIFILWLKRFISEGIYESLKLENIYLVSIEDYYTSLAGCSSLWENIIN